MSPMSNYLSGKIINHLLRETPYTPPTRTYLALYSAAILDGITETELSGNGYSRVQMSTVSKFIKYGGQYNYYVNNFSISFPMATSSWDTVKAWALKDASTSGNILYYGDMTPNLTITTGHYLYIDLYDLAIKHKQIVTNTGGWTYYINPHIIDMVLNNTSYTIPSGGASLALGRDVYFDQYGDYNLLTWTECSGAGYERAPIFGSDMWSAPSVGGSSVNTQAYYFEASDREGWGTISDVIIFEESGNDPPDPYGDWMLWGHLQTPVTINAGETFGIPVGGIKLDLK